MPNDACGSFFDGQGCEPARGSSLLSDGIGGHAMRGGVDEDAF
jgi:hypothetical protein